MTGVAPLGAVSHRFNFFVTSHSIELIKMPVSEKVTNEQVLKRIGEKKTLLNNILCRKSNWIIHILIRNCLLHDANEGQITEMKTIGRIRRRSRRRRRRRRRKRTAP